MRLIDADVLIKNSDKAKKYSSEMYVVSQEYIMNAPTIEIRETGHWIKKYDYYSEHYYNSNDNWTYYCSLCNHFMKWNGNFCPNCGAKMEYAEEEKNRYLKK